VNGGQILLLVLYVGCSAGLVLYAFHSLALLLLFRRRVRAVRTAQEGRIRAFREGARPEDWPVVTTQLPLFNEADVAERLLRRVAAMEYPAGRHEIQVLDDSTDACSALVDAVAADLRREGHDVTVFRREDRKDFKAGALREGMKAARGEVLAIFDADFLPPADFLVRTVPLLLEGEEIACVQARWGHANRRESWLTRAQSVGIDGHFAVEQGARAWNGLFMNFNGTAGIWRRRAIEAAGGWEGDTITEDLDLSYRVQLAGHRIVYSLDTVCPAEIPATADAVKSQQSRWARGSMQTARKILPRIWRAPGPLSRKIAASFHLTHYFVAVLMTLLAVLTLPVLAWVPFPKLGGWLWAAWVVVLASTLAPCFSYFFAGRVLGHAGFTLRNIPGLIALGYGLALNNALASLRGFFGGRADFVRTPKSGSLDGRRRPSHYRASASRLWWVEILLGLYCTAGLVVYFSVQKWILGLFLGFYVVGLISLGWASRPRRLPRETSVPGSPARPLVAEAVLLASSQGKQG